MKFTYKVLYALSLACVVIGVAMYAGESEGAGVALLIGAGVALLNTYMWKTDRPGR